LETHHLVRRCVKVSVGLHPLLPVMQKHHDIN